MNDLYLFSHIGLVRKRHNFTIGQATFDCILRFIGTAGVNSTRTLEYTIMQRFNR